MKKTIVWLTALITVFSINASAQTKEEAIRKTLNERYESAETDLQELIARETTNGELYHAAGDNYLYWGEIEKAEAMFRKGIEMAPANPLNYAGLGRVAWINGNDAVNTAQFEKAVTIMTTKSNKVSKPIQQLTYLKMAEAYLQNEKKNIVKALEYVNTAMNLGDTNPEVYIQLGDYYSVRDGVNLSNAIREYNTALEKDPKYTRALLRKGVLYVKIESWNEGLDYYNQAIAIDPTFAPAYREKAELLYKAGKSDKRRYDEAVEAYGKYLELNNNCRVQQRYASFIFLTKNYEKSITEMEKALPCNPENTIMYRLLGYAYYETGNYAKGKEMLDKFFQMAQAKGKPKLEGGDYGYKGKLLSKLGQDSMAVIAFQEGIAIDPNYVEGYGDLAGIYVKQKKYDLAAANYKLKIEKSKEVVLLDYYYLGIASYNNKDYAAADAAFIVSVPSYNDAIFWRGRVNNRLEVNPEMPVGLGKPYYEEYIRKVSGTPQSIEKNKKNLVESFSYLGFYYLKQENLECAKSAYTKVMELDPVNENAKIALADKEVIALTGTCIIPGYAKAYYEDYIRKTSIDAISIETNKAYLVESYLSLGAIHFALAGYECSKAAYNKALELDPANESAKLAVQDKKLAGLAGSCELIPAQ